MYNQCSYILVRGKNTGNRCKLKCKKIDDTFYHTCCQTHIKFSEVYIPPNENNELLSPTVVNIPTIDYDSSFSCSYSSERISDKP